MSFWESFRSTPRIENPEKYAERDAKNGKESSPPETQIWDHILGTAEYVQEAKDAYEKRFEQVRSVEREEQNNEYLRQIAENTRR
jgi:hypothetical protein